MQPDLFEVLFIDFYEFLDSAHHSGIEKIAIESKALTNGVVERGQLRAETVECHLVVVVEVLQQTNNIPHGLYILFA